MKKIIKKLLSRKTDFDSDFDSRKYWESRYKAGGNSGDGSYGKLANFKAEFINQFIIEHNINTVVEFGCGDGNQLSLINVPEYIGMDISYSVINLCKQKFEDDLSRSFIIYEPETFSYQKLKQVDLTLSLDVIYHIIEERLYKKYLDDLFNTSSGYVIIYGTNFDEAETTHVLHRKFLKYVHESIKSFEFIKEVPNPYPGIGEQESRANFFIFKKRV